MRKLLLVTHHPLNEHPREDLSHEAVEIGVALPQLEILPVEQYKGYDNFQHALLVIDTIRLAVEGGDLLEMPTGALLLEEGLTAPGAQQILPEGSEIIDAVLCALEL